MTHARLLGFMEGLIRGEFPDRLRERLVFVRKKSRAFTSVDVSLGGSTFFYAKVYHSGRIAVAAANDLEAFATSEFSTSASAEYRVTKYIQGLMRSRVPYQVDKFDLNAEVSHIPGACVTRDGDGNLTVCLRGLSPKVYLRVLKGLEEALQMPSRFERESPV